MSKEGSTEAPIRHPIDFQNPDFLDPEKLDAEMRRVFDICHDRCQKLFSFLHPIFRDPKSLDFESLSDV